MRRSKIAKRLRARNDEGPHSTIGETGRDSFDLAVEIPSVADLQPQSEWAAVLIFLNRGGSSDPVARSLAANFIRLSDAAVRDYSAGRSQVESFHKRRKPDRFGIGHVLEAATCFESCIWHLDRCVQHAKKLRALRDAEQELKNLISRRVSFLLPGSKRKIMAMRDAVAHLDDRAIAGELRPGNPIAVVPQKAGLRVGDQFVEWVELTAWLRDSNECATLIARFRRAM